MKVSDQTLMLFHDGELDGEGARSVRVGRLCHGSVTARLEAFSVLGDAVRLWADQAGVDAARERREEQQRRARRLAFGVGATALFATLAALFALPAQGRAGADDAPMEPALKARGEPVALPGPVAVETVDFGARPGAIFSVEGEASSETTVVWLDDAGTGTGTL